VSAPFDAAIGEMAFWGPWRGGQPDFRPHI